MTAETRGVERRTKQARETTVRRAHRPRQAQAPVACNARGCTDNALAARATATEADLPATPATATLHANRTQIADANGNGMIVGHRPSGCPSPLLRLRGFALRVRQRSSRN